MRKAVLIAIGAFSIAFGAMSYFSKKGVLTNKIKEELAVRRSGYYLNRYYKKYRIYPTKLEEIIGLNIANKKITKEDVEEMFKDPYTKQPLYYSVSEDKQGCRVDSLGKDKIKGTNDDISLMLKKGRTRGSY